MGRLFQTIQGSLQLTDIMLLDKHYEPLRLVYVNLLLKLSM
jgi:hypothetical protein